MHIRRKPLKHYIVDIYYTIDLKKLIFSAFRGFQVSVWDVEQLSEGCFQYQRPVKKLRKAFVVQSNTVFASF